MKKSKLILLVATIALVMLFVVSCGGNTICTNHVDANADGKCDTCDTAMGKQPCAECKDNDADGKCDFCQNPVEKVPCTECVDTDGDGYCDVCDEEYVVVLKEVALVQKGKANFNVVVQSGLPGNTMMAIDKFLKSLKDLGVIVNRVEDSADTVQDCEVLIGNITSRGEKYQRDMHVYGAEGYAVELVDNKVLIVPGSNDAFADAIEAFKSDFLGITSSSKKLTKAIVTTENNVVVIQDDYRVKQLTLFGEDMKGFTIAADKAVKKEYNTALAVQESIYVKTGYWFDIVPHAEADKSIVIKLADKTGGLGYSVTVEENKMTFVCEYVTCIQDEVTAFFTNKLAKAGGTGVAEFNAQDSTEKNVRDVFYKDFGAVGNGRVDDSEAIRACHEYANEGGHVVYADNGATYYIGRMTESIIIKTDVNWKDAVFMLDDAKIKPSDTAARGVNIFTVSNPGSIGVMGIKDWIAYVNENGGLDASSLTKIPLDFGENALLRIYNTDHKNYIRYGVNASDGAGQQEVILVDKDGNIDPTTPLMFDYEKITSIVVYKIDVETLTIEGGIFKTSPYLATTAQEYTAYGRGLQIGRSNVLVKNVKHYLINEGTYNYSTNTGDYGCPYGGFYSTTVCNNVIFDNCLASAHVQYKGSNGAGMGTYDISPGSSINIVFKNCYQEDANFFNKDGMSRWGVMGSSYCKNVSFIDSKLTRFDAHNGIHNAYLIRSTLKAIRVDGTGTFLMEDCTMHSNTLVGLREDYGGFWHGNVILKGNTIITASSSVNLFTNTWYNHNFGYPAAFPTNIIIDNLQVYKDTDKAPFTGTVTLFGGGILTAAEKSMEDYFILSGATYSDGSQIKIANKNKVPAPERIIIRNTEINIALPDAKQYPWFANTVFSVNEETDCTHHIDIDSNLLCDDCGGVFTPCTEHSDINKDGYCTWCNKDVPIACDKHIDIDRTGECDICKIKFTCPEHKDTDSDHLCDDCKAPLCDDKHYDTNKDCFCEVCYQKLPCQDEDADSECDICGEKIVAEETN